MIDERVVEDDVGITDATPSPLTEPAPADSAPTPAEPDPLDKLLAEFDEGTKPAVGTPEPAQPQADPLQPRVDPTQDIDARVAERWQAERAAAAEQAKVRDTFEQYCNSNQQRVAEHLPSDYYRTEMIAASVTDPRLEVAIRAKAFNVTPAAAAAEHDRVSREIVRLMINPTADPRAVQSLQSYLAELQIAYHGPTILAQHNAAILAKANRPLIDAQVTEDRIAVAAAVRGASQGKMPEEPAPDLGRLSEQEFREYKRGLGF
jgi:hypothetical protein